MYFPIGWPKYFSSRDVHCGELKSLRYNRDRSLLAVISDHSVCIWNNRVSIKFPFCRLSTGYHLCEYHLTVRALADKQSYIDKDSWQFLSWQGFVSNRLLPGLHPANNIVLIHNHYVQICEVSFNPCLPVRFRNRVNESFLTFKNRAAMYTKAIQLQTVSFGNFFE